MASNYSIGNLDGLFQPTLEAANQSPLSQTLLGSKGDKLASLLYRNPIAAPTAPQLQFGTNATGIGTGITQGLGNAVNNALQLRQYGQQQERQKQYQAQVQNQIDLAQQRDLAAALEKQAKDLAEQDRDKTFYKYLGDKAPDLAQVYAYADRATRDKIMLDVAAKQGGVSFAPIEGTAEGQKQVNKGQAINAGVAGMKPIEVEGVPQPIALDDVNQVRGFKPTTSQDITSADLDLQQKDVNLQSSKQDLAVKPQVLKQNILGKELENSIQKVNLQYADALKMIDKLTGEGKLEEAKDLKFRVGEGRKRYDQAIASYENLTPGNIKLFNSEMKSKGLELYQLPEKKENKLNPIKYKGKVTGFTDNEGHVYDKDGNPKG